MTDEEREDFNFWPLWRLLIPVGLIGTVLLCSAPKFDIAKLDELVRANDGRSGLSSKDVSTFIEYSELDSTKVESDYNFDGRLTYGNYPTGNLRKALKTYQGK